MREQLLVNYAELLMTHHSLWQMGLSYLDHCPYNGQPLIALILPSIAHGSEKRVMQILHEAQKRDMQLVGM